MTAQQQPVPQTTYQEMVSGLLRLHRYTVEKQDQTEEYHALCAAMEGYWDRLTPVERERLGGLSEDLYTVSDPPPAKLEPMTLQTHGELRDVYEARERGDWDLALTLLRKLDKIVPPPLIAYLRGTIWDGLEEKQVAVVFHERAHQLAPESDPFLAAFVNVLKWTDIERALKVAEPILADIEKHNGNVVVQAAEVLYWNVAAKPEHEAAPAIRKLISVLKMLLERAKIEPPASRGPYLHMTLFLLAALHRMVGEVREAYDYYSQLIVLEPRNDALLASRGALVYGSNPSAISDFEQAVNLNSQIVWPYYFLAHHLLTQSRFEDCWRMCLRGFDKPAPPRVHSALLEFMAISMAALGLPANLVQRTFEDAMRVDPSNERAAENLRRYLAANQTRAVTWEYPSSSSVRSSGQQQIFTSRVRGRFAFAGT
jgi:tetratricopeptide (TPR) repeat protein